MSFSYRCDKDIVMPKDSHMLSAYKCYEQALKELKKAEKNKKPILLRDACAKGWLAVIEATDALFISKGYKEESLPKSIRGRRHLLSRFLDKYARSIFMEAFGILHIAGYYQGYVDVDNEILTTLAENMGFLPDMTKGNNG